MPKQYGLIIKNKKEPKLLQKSKLSFFDDDDDELAKTTIEREIKESNAKKKVRKQTQVTNNSLFHEKYVNINVLNKSWTFNARWNKTRPASSTIMYMTT